METKATWFLAVILLAVLFQVNSEKRKRQIFREQVLPSRGGKIPEEAFRSDRLALNRLNKEGISVPDGVLLDARHVHKHPGPSGPQPEVLKVYLTPEGRYVPPEGRYNYEHPKAVDTTYLVQHPVATEAQGKFLTGYNHNSISKQHRHQGHRLQVGNPTRQHIYKPILRPLIIPSRDELLQQTYYPNWNPEYSWDVIYEPFDDYFINNIALFDSHQILTDYEGFLNDFHQRSIRHTPGALARKSAARTTGNFWLRDKSPRRDTGGSKNSGYPDLNKIPDTRFKCAERRGMFADVQTKCQVFHQCGDSGRSSFLCPAGTVFNELKKRCEWWGSVACNANTVGNNY